MLWAWPQQKNSTVDNFYGINCFYSQWMMWLDSEDISKTRARESPFQTNKINETIEITFSCKLLAAVSKMCVFLFVYCELSVYGYGFLTGEHNWLENGTLQGQGRTFHWPHRSRKLCHSHQLHQKFNAVISRALGHIKISKESFSNFQHTIRKIDTQL